MNGEPNWKDCDSRSGVSDYDVRGVSCLCECVCVDDDDGGVARVNDDDREVSVHDDVHVGRDVEEGKIGASVITVDSHHSHSKHYCVSCS